MLNRSNLIAPAPRFGRNMRRPAHSFQLMTRPFIIQPFMIAPVLPGETMKNFSFQSRVVTKPLTNPLIGWWTEYMWFYVKHRDLADREEFTQMMLQPDWSDDAVDDVGNDAKSYFAGANINWVAKCLIRVCNGDGSDAGHVHYFREAGEAWNTATIDGFPIAQITGRTLLDSAVPDAALDIEQDVDVDANNDGNVTVGEINDAMRQYQLMVEGGLVDMSYEDFLGTYGVRTKPEEAHIPELLRFVRKWTYPTNTIDPSTGSPSSAAVWSFSERADKDRFFKEPGFIFGVAVTRPKVYLKNQKGTLTSYMNNVFSWLPAVLSDDPRTSYRQVPDGAAEAFGDVTDAGGTWIDLKDLFLYGEQFVNFATTEVGKNFVALPTAGMQKRYVSEADTDGFFVSNDSANGVYHEGICTLGIAGRMGDTSVTT